LLCGEVQIDAKYPGGNIVVEGIDRETGLVRLKTDLRDTASWWFYSNFRVRGAEGKTLRFEFDREAIGFSEWLRLGDKLLRRVCRVRGGDAGQPAKLR